MSSPALSARMRAIASRPRIVTPAMLAQRRAALGRANAGRVTARAERELEALRSRLLALDLADLDALLALVCEDISQGQSLHYTSIATE